MASRAFERPYSPDVSSTERKENSNGICAFLRSSVRSAARRSSRCDKVTCLNTTREYAGLRIMGLKNELDTPLEKVYQPYAELQCGHNHYQKNKTNLLIYVYATVCV